MDVIRKLGDDHTRLTEPVSPSEMAAILLLWCDSLNHADRFDRLTDAIRNGWFDEYGSGLFEAIEQISHKIEILGFAGYTAAMFKLGRHAAQALNSEDWAEKFDDHLIAFEDRYDLNRY
jgi:hypothetical protein